MPVPIALRGIPSYFAEAGSCTIAMPSCSLMALRPSVPSLPIPERMMPIGLFLLVRGQVPEEEIDRRPQPPRRGRFEHLELAVQDGQVGVRRNHVDAVRLDLHPVLHLDDLHLGVPSKEFRHHALMRRLKMLHQDECHPGSRGQVGEELLKRL